MKQKVKQLLREALGVPDNIIKLSTWVYDEFVDRLKTNLPDSDGWDFDGWDDNVLLKGNFNIADYRFSKIKINYNIRLSKSITEPSVYGMAFSYKSDFNDSTMQLKNVSKSDTVELIVNIAIGKGNTAGQIIREFEKEKNLYASSFAHELKHAYDTYKKNTTPLTSNTEYRVFSKLRFGIGPIDEFIHNLYYTHMMEGLVRTTEVAMNMEILGINKKDFIEFLANNRTYKTLKEINSFNMNDFRNKLIANKDAIINSFNDSDVPIPNTDEELVNEVLDLTFKNIKHGKIRNLTDYLGGNNPFAMLFGFGDSNHTKFINDYTSSLEKFKNYQEYFAYEEKMFKFVSEKLIRKINKLYAMAKDDPNVSALMQKINSKSTTNESILDWDLHYETDKIPVTKLRKDL